MTEQPYINQALFTDEYGDTLHLDGNVEYLDISITEQGASASVCLPRPQVEEFYNALSSLFPEPENAADDGTAPAFEEPSANFEILQVAERHGLVVEFNYSKTEHSPIERRRLRVTGHYTDSKDNVLTVGTDPDRDDDIRNFRLDRIKGVVNVAG